MNRIIDELMHNNYNLAKEICHDLDYNGCTFPAIRKVTYNTKLITPESDAASDADKIPVLTTIVEFVDGTKSIVKNSIKDPISTVDVDGTIIASDNSKEIGLMYAIVKRIISPVKNFKLVDNGFINKINKFINNSVDANLLKKEQLKASKTNKKAKTFVKKDAKLPTVESLNHMTRELVKSTKNLAALVTDILGG